MSLKKANEIKARLGINPTGKVQKYFANRVYQAMTKYVPGGTSSHLNKVVDIDFDGVTYMSPDAHYLYNGELYVDPITKKGAFYSPEYGFWSRPSKSGIKKIPSGKKLKIKEGSAHWDEKCWAVEKDKIIKDLENFIERG